MHIITFGTDQHMLNPGSRQHKRLLSYVNMVDRYTAVIFSKQSNDFKAFEYGKLKIIQVPKRRLIKQLVLLWRVLKKEVGVSNASNAVLSAQDPFEVGLLSYVFAKLLKLPLHIQIHTAIQSPISQKENLRSRMQYCISLWIIRRAQAVRVVSESIKDFLVSKKMLPSEAIFKAAVIEDFNGNIRTKGYVVGERIKLLCIARFVYFKNLPTLLKAFKAIIEKYPNCELTIVGGGSLRSKMEQDIKDLQLSKFVTLLDWVPEVDDLYRASHMFIVPSYYEGFGMVAIEALQRGLPVIVTPEVGSVEYVKTSIGGFVAKGYAVEDLIEAIEHGINHLIFLNPADIHKTLVIPSKEKNDTIIFDSWKYALTHNIYEKTPYHHTSSR